MKEILHRNGLLLIGLVAACLLASGCTKEAADKGASAPSAEQETKPEPFDETEIVVEVDGRPFTLADLLQFWGKFDTRPLWNRGNLAKTVDRMVNDHLIARLAAQDEAFELPPEARSKILTSTSALWRDFYWNTLVKDQVVISDDEVFGAIPPQSETVTVRVMVAKTRERAEQLLEQARDTDDFRKLVEENSTGLSAEGGGLSENIRREATNFPPEVLDVMFELEEGSFSPVMPTPIGFMFVRVEDKKSAEDWKQQLFPAFAKKYRDDKARRVWKETLAHLVEQHEVETNDELLEKIEASGGKFRRSWMKEVLATVDDHAFILSDIADPTGMGMMHGAVVVKGLLGTAVENYALREDLRARGITDPGLVMMEEFTTNNITARAYLDYRSESVVITPEAIQEAYDDNKDEEFTSKAMARYSAIETRSPDRVELIYDELRSGKSFADVAIQWSDHKSAKNGGDLGLVQYDRVAPAYQRMTELEVGEYLKEPLVFSRPEEFLEIYLIVKKTEHLDEGYQPLDDNLKQVIAGRLMAWERQNVVSTVLQELHEMGVEIVVHEDVLDRYNATLERPETPATPGAGPLGFH